MTVYLYSSVHVQLTAFSLLRKITMDNTENHDYHERLSLYLYNFAILKYVLIIRRLA